MSGNYVQKGKVLTLTAPYAVSSGQGALVGALFGVSLSDVANAAEGEFQIAGVFELAKTSAQAWTQGQKIYWDNSNKRCDSDGTVGVLIGVAASVAANPSSTGIVRLNGVAPAASEGPQNAIADLALTTLTDTPASADALRDNLTSTWEAELEAKVNAILAALRTAGIIASS